MTKLIAELGLDTAVKSFEAPSKSIGDVKAESAALLLAAAADIALVIDRKGIIKDSMFLGDEATPAGFDTWIGRPWIDTVTIESRNKVEELLSNAAQKSKPRWRQVNHPMSEGRDLPIRYSAVQIGPPNKFIAIGQDLRQQAGLQQRLVEAQSSMEREYARLRHAETRYRALFQVSSEAVLIVDANSLRIVEANPAATQLLANGTKRTTGRSFADLFHPDSANTALDLLSTAQSMPRVDGVEVLSAGGRRRFVLSASLFRQDDSSHFLVRLRGVTSESEVAQIRSKASVLQVVEAMPDAFVVADKDRRIVACNQAFLELCELARESQLKGEPLDRWLGRVGVDIDVLIAHLREHGSIKRFTTVVRGEFGGQDDVEISGIYIPDRNNATIGLTVRRMEKRLEAGTAGSQQLPRSVEQLTGLVGRVPLKELVRETTDIVERLCIEAALELTQDNRASAAEMLGLSRQSFYVKMRRHGLGELGGDVAD